MDKTLAKSVKDRSMVLFDTCNLSDVTFLVGTSAKQKTFKAHKLVLAAASEVFEAMFYGSMPETSSAIKIPDADPQGFEKMLRYLYLDDNNFETTELALVTLPLAHKYMLTHLQELCSVSAIKNINVDTACKILEFANLYDLNRVKKMAMYYICENATKVLSSDGFLDAHIKTLEKILIQNHLNTSEDKLIESVIKWARKECVRQHKNQDWKDIRCIITPLLPHLRLAVLSTDRFMSLPLENKILNENESLSVLMNIVKPGSKALPGWCCNKGKRAMIPSLQSAVVPDAKPSRQPNYNNYNHHRSSYDYTDHTENPIVIECKLKVSEGSVIISSLIFKDQNIFYNAYDQDYYGYAASPCRNVRATSISATLLIRNVLENFTLNWQVTFDPKQSNRVQISLPIPLVVCEGEMYEISLVIGSIKGIKSQNDSTKISTHLGKAGPFQFHRMSESSSERKYYFHEIHFVPVTFNPSKLEKTSSKNVILI